MIHRFFNNLNNEQKQVFNNILESYCFEVNDYSTANKLGAALTKALPLYFFRCIPLPDENDMIFRIFHMKTSFTTPITVSKYSEFIKVIT
jgi:hypothetical protein